MDTVLTNKATKLYFAFFFLFSGFAHAELNDTGADLYVDEGGLSLFEPPNYPGQDPRFGRDAAAAAGKLTKIGSGDKGFDFTKIANDRSELPESAALGSKAGDWACTRDNVTGLTWEVKTNDGGLRDKDWRYNWYSTDFSINAGYAGDENGGSCVDNMNCDTEKYTQQVNASGLCGYADWRMPSIGELRSLVDYGRKNPAIDVDFFPNTIVLSQFMSASVHPIIISGIWTLGSRSGSPQIYNRNNPFSVRLVRGKR